MQDLGVNNIEEEEEDYSDDEDDGPPIDLSIRLPTFKSMRGELVLKGGQSMQNMKDAFNIMQFNS